MSNGVAGYIFEMAIALIMTGFLVPLGMSYLFNGSSWGTTDAIIVTLGTTVLGIMVVIGLMLRFMPPELKSRVGMWYKPNIPQLQVKTEHKARKMNQKKVLSVSHFEIPH